MTDAAQTDIAALLATAAPVQGLIALIADPKGSAARLSELQKVVADLDAAQKKLDADRAEHEAQVAKDKADHEANLAKATRYWAEANTKIASLESMQRSFAGKVFRDVANGIAGSGFSMT